jgi:hypothetical protein
MESRHGCSGPGAGIANVLLLEISGFDMWQFFFRTLGKHQYTHRTIIGSRLYLCSTSIENLVSGQYQQAEACYLGTRGQTLAESILQDMMTMTGAAYYWGAQ